MSGRDEDREGMGRAVKLNPLRLDMHTSCSCWFSLPFLEIVLRKRKMYCEFNCVDFPPLPFSVL